MACVLDFHLHTDSWATLVCFLFFAWLEEIRDSRLTLVAPQGFEFLFFSCAAFFNGSSSTGNIQPYENAHAISPRREISAIKVSVKTVLRMMYELSPIGLQGNFVAKVEFWEKSINVYIASAGEKHSIQRPEVATVPLGLVHLLLDSLKLALSFSKLPISYELEVSSDQSLWNRHA